MSPAAAGTRTVDGVEIPSPGVFDIDASHSVIAFSVRHLMVSRTRGRFGTFSGTVAIAQDPTESKVDVTILASSIETGDEKRDGHLRSPDFLDVDQFPEITFRSTAVTDHHGDRFKLAGDLTVHGVTKAVSLDAVIEGIALSPSGTQAIGFSASTDIDREAFGLKWNQALEAGGVLVGKAAKVEIEAELTRRAD